MPKVNCHSCRMEKDFDHRSRNWKAIRTAKRAWYLTKKANKKGAK